MTTTQRSDAWAGVLLFGFGAALIVGVITSMLQPTGFAQGFAFGLLGGILIASGLSLIIRSSRGVPQ